MIIVIGICCTGGCVNQSQSPVPSENQTTFICKEGQYCSQQNISSISKANLSEAGKKLSTDLLLLTGSENFPQGMNKDILEQQMKQDHQLIWIDHAGNISEYETDDAVVYVYIKFRENINAGLLDSFAWNVTNTDPANHLVVAWVDVKNLTTLASDDSVQSIQTVLPPRTA